MSAIMEIRHLVKRFDKIEAVNGVSFTIPPGVCFGLLGPNGAGKTTTIEMMEGILEPTSGEILYRGEPLGKRFRHEVGIQFQETALQEFITVGETLEMFMNLYERTMPWQELVSLCALEELLDRDTKQLSGGQRQRLLLALALVNDPEVVFLDEPTTGLDPQARRNFWDLVRLIRQRNKTIILTTHYMEEANALCDEILIIDKGRIIAQGTPEALLRDHFGDSIIQLPEDQLESLTRAGLGLNWQQRQGWLELQTHDVQETLRLLMDAGISVRKMRLRAWSLEDLFISLTGKKLRQ